MRKIIAVASGKGGVGKSTVAANLAVVLANYGGGEKEQPLKVALIDVDFYGPSIPVIMGDGEIAVNPENNLIIPAEAHLVKYISIAFFLKNNDDPVIWRGPRFGKAMEQLFNDVEWGEIDIAVVDLPPGTGDAQLSLTQVVNLDGVILVTTPQEISLSDVRRAVNMFTKVNVPVLGVIENMAGFKLPDGSVVDIFGAGGGKVLAAQYDLNFLGSIPLNIAIRESGDNGRPLVLDKNHEITVMYRNLADKVIRQLDMLQTKAIKIEN
ncbi:MAG: Mrp/NBP35 family ATP-binding protein [Deltaproteobacteria bacterium]|jgi:ATP-binding protein involved in chromosome partitioning|nr:Mrp/NBP35 family ATP-binding protein [Deltaproteobacteria bacterium]